MENCSESPRDGRSSFGTPSSVKQGTTRLLALENDAYRKPQYNERNISPDRLAAATIERMDDGFFVAEHPSDKSSGQTANVTTRGNSEVGSDDGDTFEKLGARVKIPYSDLRSYWAAAGVTSLVMENVPKQSTIENRRQSGSPKSLQPKSKSWRWAVGQGPLEEPPGNGFDDKYSPTGIRRWILESNASSGNQDRATFGPPGKVRVRVQGDRRRRNWPCWMSVASAVLHGLCIGSSMVLVEATRTRMQHVIVDQDAAEMTNIRSVPVILGAFAVFVPATSGAAYLQRNNPLLPRTTLVTLSGLLIVTVCYGPDRMMDLLPLALAWALMTSALLHLTTRFVYLRRGSPRLATENDVTSHGWPLDNSTARCCHLLSEKSAARDSV